MSIEVVGMARLLARFRRIPEAVRTDVVRHIQRDELRPLASDIRSAAGSDRQSRRAASTMHVAASRDGGAIRVGGGGGLGSTVLQGAEYGGQRKPRRPYVTRSPRGTAYVVRRRATMQFRPNLGRRGYWFWPSARRDLKGIRKRIRQVAAKALNDG